MFFDLGLAGDHQRAVVAASSRMGYDCVAVCHRITGVPRASDRCGIVPLSADDLSTAELPGLGATLRLNGRLSWEQSVPPAMRQLSRLTVAAADQAEVAGLTEARDVLASYDIIAVQPLSEQALRQACMSPNVDIISLNLGQRLPFKLRPQVLRPALARGAAFEVAYSQALREPSVRMNVINNAQALCRATSGRGILLSSGTSSTFELRGPYDVMNLATLMGLSQQAAKEAITSNCQAVLQAAARRRLHKGCLQVLGVTPDGGGAMLAGEKR